MRKVCIIPVLLCILSLKVAGQPTQSKYSIGFHFKPCITTSTLEYHGVSSSTYPILCFGFGSGITRNLKSNLNLESGLFYQQRGYGVHDAYYRDYSIDGSFYPVISMGHSRVLYNYLDVPLIINYDLLNNENAKFVCKIGVISNFLIGRSMNSEISYPEDFAQHNRDFDFRTSNDIGRLVNLSMIASISTSIAISEKYKIQIETFADYLLLDEPAALSSGQRFLTIGISTSIYYGL